MKLSILATKFTLLSSCLSFIGNTNTLGTLNTETINDRDGVTTNFLREATRGVAFSISAQGFRTLSS